MTKQTPNPSHPPEPESQEPRGDGPRQPVAPGDSFYAPGFTTGMQKKLTQARKIESLDSEIAILRLRLRRILIQDRKSHEAEDDNSKAQKRKYELRIFKAIELIIRAYAAKIRASKGSDDPDDTAVIDALREAADTLGLDRVPWSGC